MALHSTPSPSTLAFPAQVSDVVGTCFQQVLNIQHTLTQIDWVLGPIFFSVWTSNIPLRQEEQED